MNEALDAWKQPDFLTNADGTPMLDNDGKKVPNPQNLPTDILKSMYPRILSSEPSQLYMTLAGQYYEAWSFGEVDKDTYGRQIKILMDDPFTEELERRPIGPVEWARYRALGHLRTELEAADRLDEYNEFVGRTPEFLILEKERAKRAEDPLLY